jgi:DhnA family fructose-bisphosphate aldolase class Ia
LGPVKDFAVIVAMDHGIAGFVNGLHEPANVLAKVIVENPRGVLLNAGLARRLIREFSALDSPCLIVALDQVIHSGPRGAGPAVAHGPQVSVEEAMRLGADAVKTMLVMGLDRAAELDNLHYLARTAEQCHQWEIPLMVEPYLWGAAVPADAAERAQLGADGARNAIETGADVLKIEYPGDPGLFEQIVRSSPVPVVVLGGPRRPTQREVLEDVIAAARAGAVGVTMGRNIWDQQDPAAMIRAIRVAVRCHDLNAAAAQLISPSQAV